MEDSPVQTPSCYTMLCNKTSISIVAGHTMYGTQSKIIFFQQNTEQYLIEDGGKGFSYIAAAHVSLVCL